MHHPFEHDITALAYDLVEGAERDTLLEHLSGCDQCRAVYDSYRDEQVVVRDAIVRDARSGAAEAKALEATLRMLGGVETSEPKRGRLIRFPAWLIVAEIAAMLLVAVGLFFILKPGEETSTDVIAVAPADRAPGVVEAGVAYVQDDSGTWKEAEAVPVDQWVSTGPDKFAIRLENGSLTELEPDSVFRISFSSGAGQPIVYMLSGDGVVNNFGISQDVQVCLGDASFYAMPGARFELACVGSEGALRSWSAPESVRASVLNGDVVLWNKEQPGSHVPLRAGEVVEWNPADMRVLAGDDAVIMDMTALFLPTGQQANPEVEALLLRQIETRVHELQLRLGEGPEAARWMKDLEGRRRMVALQTRRDDQQSVVLIENDISLTLTTDGVTLTLAVKDSTGTTTYEKKSVEALKVAVTQRIADLLVGIEIKEVDGKFELAGAQAQSYDEGVRTFVRIRKDGEGKDGEGKDEQEAEDDSDD